MNLIEKNLFTKIIVYDNYQIIQSENVGYVLHDLAKLNRRAIKKHSPEVWQNYILREVVEHHLPYHSEIKEYSIKSDLSILEKKLEEINYKKPEEKEQEILKHGGISVELSKVQEKATRTINNSLDMEALYTELAKLEPFNDKKLLEFSKIFGLPTGQFVAMGWDAVFENNYILKQFSFLLPLYLKLASYRYIFNGWLALKENNESIILEFENRYKHYLEAELSRLEIPKERGGFAEKLPEIITVFLNEKGPKRILEPINSKIIQKFNFSDLFDIAYYQLSQAMLNDSSFKRCELCGHPFEVIHEGRRFCPPLPGRKRSTCENTFNQRLKRAKKKALTLHEEGKSINEISELTKDAEVTIRKWIEQKGEK
ncbi:hypothetical protein ACQKOM_14585 [Peribacillus frigoritolerans]|uniref:hypothetical protein n=1 Tax=Peribacillus frigoritolerans TaxID=450367 RepID=UPI003CFF126A